MNVIEELKSVLKQQNVLQCESMANHTSFRIGGAADIYISPHNAEEIKKIIAVAEKHNVAVNIVGNGSNLLVRDKGIRGIVIQIAKDMNHISVEGQKIKAQAGALLSAIGAVALQHHLKGFEFASGIPGSLGGAVCMNAGAYGGEMKDIVLEVEVLTKELECKTLAVNELDFAYRHSIIPEKGYIVLSAVLQLQKGEHDAIENRMTELAEQRRQKQPLNFASAGSTFKRPEGYFAGKLISDAGLKGYRIGDAQVSEKHGGFVINRGNATCAEVMELIKHCQKTVFEKFGVLLETEVKVIGEE
ncbi:UDP-N-acetylmuramate dehydrogenase [Clostridium sp. MD294]|uniref:UDP-N-acetylmuramate dehydrogenase n=1 Tax=Clostridium sp. MD294 TaxID=97138 RepID=UPI0002CBCB39|nr:UDP-N-acetylmuramate dehydrogenase [Clostridium sp. MD294]NDO45866.1 UDP-N-acetylmuramate dehydrogenase [Clostridium sp. MD294]USF30476.1 UDP-N-acetylenolpyruvoylglucosamine reductase [Clostridium sp. MD294]